MSILVTITLTGVMYTVIEIIYNYFNNIIIP